MVQIDLAPAPEREAGCVIASRAQYASHGALFQAAFRSRRVDAYFMLYYPDHEHATEKEESRIMEYVRGVPPNFHLSKILPKERCRWEEVWSVEGDDLAMRAIRLQVHITRRHLLTRPWHPVTLTHQCSAEFADEGLSIRALRQKASQGLVDRHGQIIASALIDRRARLREMDALQALLRMWLIHGHVASIEVTDEVTSRYPPIYA